VQPSVGNARKRTDLFVLRLMAATRSPQLPRECSTMNVSDLDHALVRDYSRFARSFTQIRAAATADLCPLHRAEEPGRAHDRISRRHRTATCATVALNDQDQEPGSRPGSFISTFPAARCRPRRPVRPVPVAPHPYPWPRNVACDRLNAQQPTPAAAESALRVAAVGCGGFPRRRGA
jgi:hypothetical protein